MTYAESTINIKNSTRTGALHCTSVAVSPKAGNHVSYNTRDSSLRIVPSHFLFMAESDRQQMMSARPRATSDNGSEPSAGSPVQADEKHEYLSRAQDSQDHYEQSSPDDKDADVEAARDTVAATATPEAVNYSVFTRREKIFITAMASMTSFFSPFTASVYLPAINTLAVDYHTTVSKINLTITTYMILQAIAPMFTGDFGDTAGRRPAVVLCLVIYMAANIGLAVQDSYAALLIVRMLQSAGSSGTVALARGIIADVITPAERGTFMGVAFGLVMFAPAIAPIIGGVLANTVGWRWIFWFLAIFSGSFLLAYVALMPETNRHIVGDGSIRPTKWYHVSLMDVFRRRRETKCTSVVEGSLKPHHYRPSLKGPWRTITLFLEKDIALISVYGCFLYGALYAFLTSTPVIFAKQYGLNDLQVGLCYLPIGIGCSIASFVNGRVLDWNWRRVAIKSGHPTDRRKNHDLRNFPIEKARLQVVFPTLLPGLMAMLPYGWALQYNAPLAVPLVLQFIIGWSLAACGNATQNLSVDLFPGMTATVSANNNLSRCLFGAGTAAVINPMLEGMGWGWTYTFITLLVTLSYPILYWVMRSGPRWREERRLRNEARAAGQREKAAQKAEAAIESAKA